MELVGYEDVEARSHEALASLVVHYKMMERNRYEMEELYGKESKMYNVGCMLPYMSYEPKTLKEIEDGYDMSKYMVIKSNGEEIKG